MTAIVVSGSYGRDYTSAKAAQADWAANKDFTIRTFGPDTGRQINKQDADAAGVTVQIRYKRDRGITGPIKPARAKA